MGRHVGVPARLRDTNMAAGNQQKHMEFTLAISKPVLSAELSNIDIDVSITC